MVLASLQVRFHLSFSQHMTPTAGPLVLGPHEGWRQTQCLCLGPTAAWALSNMYRLGPLWSTWQMGGGGWETWRHTHVHRDQEKCINAVKETETERGVRGRQRRRNELAQRQGGERKQRRATRTGRTEGWKDGRRCREEGKKREGTQERPTQGKERQERTARNQRRRQIRGRRPLRAGEGGGQRGGPCRHFWGRRCCPGWPFWASCGTGGVGSFRTGPWVPVGLGTVSEQVRMFPGG